MRSSLVRSSLTGHSCKELMNALRCPKRHGRRLTMANKSLFLGKFPPMSLSDSASLATSSQLRLMPYAWKFLGLSKCTGMPLFIAVRYSWRLACYVAVSSWASAAYDKSIRPSKGTLNYAIVVFSWA